MAPAAQRLRARALGLRIGFYSPGPHNAITDVAGVRVGHVTVVRGVPAARGAETIVRTGVTAVLPRTDVWSGGVFAATHTLNGDGEMTGTRWIRDLETLTHPVLLTGTRSVGAVYDAALAYIYDRVRDRRWGMLPVVAETWDGLLNDLSVQSIEPSHVYDAIDLASDGEVAEGNVGSGTGMVCYDFKGGIGTASRSISCGAASYTIGVLLQANFGSRPQLVVDGVPVGRVMTDLMPETGAPAPGSDLHEGSVIVVIATDAPLSSVQLKRLARRGGLGLARTGSISANTSGDIIIAFSTANVIPLAPTEIPLRVSLLPSDLVDPLFQGVVEATEEAVLNAICAGVTMLGVRGNVVHGLPYDRLARAFEEHGRRLTLPPAARVVDHA